jgi:prepilin-type processing-associated H-X9-DG protein
LPRGRFDTRGTWCWDTIGASGFTCLNTPNSSAGDAMWDGDSGPECYNDPLAGMPCSYNHSATDYSTFHAAARSRHPGGVNTVFGDAHVTFIPDMVDAVMWKRMGSVNDGLPIVGDY